MAERSVSIFLFDSFTLGPADIAAGENALEIEEWRAFTTDDSVPDALLLQAAKIALQRELWETASNEYRNQIMSELDKGNEDFRVNLAVGSVDLSLGAVTRVVVIRNTPATSHVQIREDDDVTEWEHAPQEKVIALNNFQEIKSL
jgi:hypothetical protein